MSATGSATAPGLTGPLTDHTWVSVLAHHARHCPDHVAVVCEDCQVTYGELAVRACELADALATLGVGAEHRVAFIGPESTDYYALLFACAMTQAVVVPINFRLSTAEVEHILADSGAKVAVCCAQTAERAQGSSAAVVLVQEWSPSVARPNTSGLEGSSSGPGWLVETATRRVAEAADATGPNVPIAQLYTSGTTGLPKGVVLAHRSYFAVREALANAGLAWIDPTCDDVLLVGIPGFHVGGLWWSMQGFAAGGTVVALPSFDPGLALRVIGERQVTMMCVVPAMLTALLAVSAAPDSYESVRKVVYGGSPITEAVLRRALAVMGCEFAQIYGLTETGNTAVCLPPHAHREGSVLLQAAGTPYPGFAVSARDENGVEVATGEVGEIWLRTPAAMVEYFNLPDATAMTLVDGWVRTGDAGFLDADGFIHLRDRLKDMIVVAGENVYPAQVENALGAHPAVRDVAVVGAPDPVTGEAVHAFVETTGEVTPRELFVHCRGRLAAFQTPRKFHIVEGIPRNPSGKIVRRQLREPLWRDYERKVN